jgi:hypothetical protein
MYAWRADWAASENLTPRILAVIKFSEHIIGLISGSVGRIGDENITLNVPQRQGQRNPSPMYRNVIIEKGRGGCRALWQWTIGSLVGREVV